LKKAKLNLSVRDESRRKLDEMAAREKRSISNLIEIMADERYERLIVVNEHGLTFAREVAAALGLKSIDWNDPEGRKKLRARLLERLKK
jgi:hypothetical protein